MASYLIKLSAFTFCLFFFIANGIASGIEYDLAKEKTTRLRFYFHEVVNDPYATSFVVASRHENSSGFGDIRAFDNALTEGPEPSSKLIGRAQGISVTVSADQTALLAEINFVFTAGEFKGSTITTFGTIQASMDADQTIVGGSGQFRLARGYAQRKLVSYTTSSYNVEFHLYVIHS